MVAILQKQRSSWASHSLEHVHHFRFLGSNDLSWKFGCGFHYQNAQKHFYFLFQLKKFGISWDILILCILKLKVLCVWLQQF